MAKRILFIGDFHGKFPTKLKSEIKKADIVFSLGDFGGSDKLLKVIFKYFAQGWYNVVGEKKAAQYVKEDYESGKKILEELGKFQKPIYTIPGNWDFLSHSKLERTAKLKFVLYPELAKKIKNLVWWRRGIKRVDNLKVLAFGGFLTSSNYTKKGGHFSKDKNKFAKYKRWEKKEINQLMKHASKDIDILISHWPMENYYDEVRYKGENPMNGKHVGFSGYLTFVKKYQPKVFVSGHMHEHQGVKKLGKTLVISTGSAKEGKACVLYWPEKKGEKIKVELIK